MQVADDRLGAQDGFAVQLEHEAQHAMGRRMLRTHVDDHGVVFGDLGVDVVRIDGDPFGQSQYAFFQRQFARVEHGAAVGQFLDTFAGLLGQLLIVVDLRHDALLTGIPVFP